MVEERDPAVVGLHVLPDAAVGYDDEAADRIVRAALGRVDGAVDLHVRRHRVERAVGGRVDRQAEAIADEKGCGPGWGCCANTAPAAMPMTSAAAAAMTVCRFMAFSSLPEQSRST